MKLMWTSPAPFMNNTRCAEEGSVRAVLLALVSFSLGVAVTAFWFHRPAGGNATSAVSQTGVPPPVVGPPPAPAPVALAPAAKPQPPDPAVIAEVKKLVPNFASISLEEGENILRAAALKEFAGAAGQTDARIKAAQQQLQAVQNGQSAEEQQNAMKNVQDAQLAGLEKLKDIAARLQAQIAALKSLKNQQ
jgi:hypothetical protein